MTRSSLLLFLALIALSCDSDTPTAPSAPLRTAPAAALAPRNGRGPAVSCSAAARSPARGSLNGRSAA